LQTLSRFFGMRAVKYLWTCLWPWSISGIWRRAHRFW